MTHFIISKSTQNPLFKNFEDLDGTERQAQAACREHTKKTGFLAMYEVYEDAYDRQIALKDKIWMRAYGMGQKCVQGVDTANTAWN